MEKHNILIIEDSRFHGFVTKDILKKNGYEVTWVLTAEEALELNSFDVYDVILLDVILPGISGYDMCKILKDKNPLIPVIMFTSIDDEKSLIFSLESGADDYIKKPYSINELLARIKVQIRTKKLQEELIKKNEELKKAYETIKIISVTDALTGAYNRGYIREYIDNLSLKSNGSYIELACIMIDIDNFKKVNDTYGHLTGDNVLRNVAYISRNCVEDNGKIIRFGGEEFLIILDKNLDKAFDIAEKIRYDCENSRCCGFTYTVSLGVSVFQADTKNLFNDLEEGIKEADKMLYVSKNIGKNKVSINRVYSK